MKNENTKIKEHKYKIVFSYLYGGFIMNIYTYKSLSNRYPQPNQKNPIRSVLSVTVKKGFSIITMNRKATKSEIYTFQLKKL